MCPLNDPSAGTLMACLRKEQSSTPKNTLSNEGGLQAERFRVHLPDPNVSHEEMARLFVASLAQGDRLAVLPMGGSQHVTRPTVNI